MGVRVLRHGAITTMTFLAVLISGYANDGKDFLGFQYPEVKEEIKIGGESISFEGEGRGNRRGRGLSALIQSVFSAHGFVTLGTIALFTAIGFGLAKLAPLPVKINDAQSKLIGQLNEAGIKLTEYPEPQGNWIPEAMHSAAFIAGIIAVVFLSDPFGGEWPYVIVAVLIWVFGIGCWPSTKDSIKRESQVDAKN